ncbi:MAG: inositol monophosphatase family protein [Gemmatimonadaceae bacterium]
MDWLATLETVARGAGSAALRRYRTDLTVQTKSDGSPVTIADREAEEAARAWIVKRFPEDGVIGEEGGYSGPPNAGRQWVIDPIDGTRTFLRGVPLWGSMIGVMQSNIVLAGAVFCPALDELVVAAEGAGCWHNGSRCEVSTVSDLRAATILTTDDRFPGHADRQQRWMALSRRVAVARTWGDCYGYLLVATGRAEVMADNALSLWDYAPLVPIIREAGGAITDWRGQSEFGGDAIATNRALSEQVHSALIEAAAPASLPR